MALSNWSPVGVEEERAELACSGSKEAMCVMRTEERLALSKQMAQWPVGPGNGLALSSFVQCGAVVRSERDQNNCERGANEHEDN